MKRMIYAAVAVAAITAGTAFAQMSGGTMGGMQHEGMGGQQGGMQHGQTMQQGGMMEHGQMMGDMTGMAEQMSGMMNQISSQMKDMPAGNMASMSVIMKDLSQQMMAMSNAMKTGKVSAREMKHMQVRMAEIQKKMSALGKRQ